MEYSLQCNGITKKFDSTVALDNVSIDFKKNQITGLLGRNGAGKTTLLKILGNQLFANKGKITIDNQGSNQEDKVCLVRDHYPSESVKEMRCKHFLELGRLRYPNWDNDFEKYLIKLFQLPVNKKYKALSDGQRTSLSNIIGLASRSEITMFDEPYNGLDAVSRQLFFDILASDFNKYPRTIIVTSHLINEIEDLLQNVIIINHGKIILNESLEEIQENSLILEGPEDVIQQATKHKNVLNTEGFSKLVSCAVYDHINNKQRLELSNNDVQIKPLKLQKLFYYLTRNNEMEDTKYEL